MSAQLRVSPGNEPVQCSIGLVWYLSIVGLSRACELKVSNITGLLVNSGVESIDVSLRKAAVGARSDSIRRYYSPLGPSSDRILMHVQDLSCLFGGQELGPSNVYVGNHAAPPDLFN